MWLKLLYTICAPVTLLASGLVQRQAYFEENYGQAAKGISFIGKHGNLSVQAGPLADPNE